MRNRIHFLLSIFSLCLPIGSEAQSKDMFISKLTAINPTSYTDVVFMGIKDTAIVSTFSGRVSLRINGTSKETTIANLDDEVYSLAYNPIKKEIAASTFEEGIKIIKQKSGNIIKILNLKTTWANNIFYSDNYHYLIAHDQKGNRYIWDATKDYQEIIISSEAPMGRIVKMDTNNDLTILTSKKMIVWNFSSETIEKETDVEIVKFGDMDNLGNILSIDFNECSKYNIFSKKNDFVLKHPNWLRYLKDYPNYENMVKNSPQEFTKDGFLIMEDYSMQLTMVKFAKNKIYTASIDRSIRIWDKESGNMIDTLTGHKATVNKIKVNKSETQIVSVDLKGGIKFWNISSN